ncbi:hypothetical protein Taro_050405 [Colocasia esculenta]|uniref:Uncharacterized protein n=1 Tax=Colocasia esculenta TaxID=4460 RepID=A0A843XDS3_COLES|nr:hypothetical protein [Colocasia esculenta]
MVWNGDPWSFSRMRVCACEGDGPGRRVLNATARPIAFIFASLYIALARDPRGARQGLVGVVLVGLHSCLTCSREAAVGPFVCDCETERLFLCCVVRDGYWPDQPVVHSRVVASLLSDSCFASSGCGLCDSPVEFADEACGLGKLWFSGAMLRVGVFADEACGLGKLWFSGAMLRVGVV